MAKIPFSKLGIKPQTDTVTLQWGDSVIEVIKYLPMAAKATTVGNIINLSIDDNGYYNPLKVKVNLVLETLYAYTNLSFTAKMKEEPLKLYDLVTSSGLFDKVRECIPADEWKEIDEMVWHTISNLYAYKNSVMGVLEAVQDNYSGLALNADDIQQKLQDPESLELLKTVLEKMG
jgi:hypothetical protein